MKAIVRRRYGSSEVLELHDLPKPVPSEGSVLIRVRAASLNPFDWHMMRGTPSFMRLFTGMIRPKQIQLGVDVAGTVVAIGPGVSNFRPGDEVFGVINGALAEYACGPVSAVVLRPMNISPEAAAAVPIAGLTALQGFRDKGHLKPGDSVLINGASGGVGTFAVQIAKYMNANITAVCSGRNVELLRSIGADRVIDYTHEDFTAGCDRYDVIFDLVGNRPLPVVLRILKPKGIFIGCGGGGPSTSANRLILGMLRSIITNLFVSQKLTSLLARRNQTDLELLSQLMANGSINPVIDRRYCLAEVPAAIQYLEQGHARGKVVVVMEQH